MPLTCRFIDFELISMKLQARTSFCFDFTMKAPKVITVLAFLLFESRTQVVCNKLIESFIAKSDKTIAVVTIDNADHNFSFPETRSLIIFSIQSENFNQSEITGVGGLKSCNEDFATELVADYIIFSSALLLRWTVSCIVNEHRKFLFYVMDNEIQFSETNFLEILNKTWTEKQNFKVFLAINDSVYSFDPFFNVNGSFGKLNSASELNFETEMLSNLNGYQINVEMFESTYTVSKVKKPKSIEDFKGPDVEAAMFIRDRLNATSKLKM